jgi:glucokinase
VRGEKRGVMQIKQTGRLEQVIGGHGIEARWREILDRSGVAHNSELTRLHAVQIFDLARDGDPLAVKVTTYAATVLADTITDIALLLNPAIVVLGGGVGSHPELCRHTQILIDKNEFARPRLRSSPLGTQAQLIGALSLSVEAAEACLLL